MQVRETPQLKTLCCMLCVVLCTSESDAFLIPLGECLPGACLARYFSINYPHFSPRFTLSWIRPPSRPRCIAHLPYKARCIIKQ